MSKKKHYAISDKRYNRLLKEREEAKKEIFKLPSYHSDGKIRYIDVENDNVDSDGNLYCYYVYDDKARLIESYVYGDKTKYYFNDKKKTVKVISYWADYGYWEKGTYDVFTPEEEKKYEVWFGDRKERERKYQEELRKKP